MANHSPSVSLMNNIPGTWLYPSIEPYNAGRLQVSPVHEIYFEESGNPAGKPVIFLHGGPGGGSDPKQRRYACKAVDRARYREGQSLDRRRSPGSTALPRSSRPGRHRGS